MWQERVEAEARDRIDTNPPGRSRPGCSSAAATASLGLFRDARLGLGETVAVVAVPGRR